MGKVEQWCRQNDNEIDVKVQPTPCSRWERDSWTAKPRTRRPGSTCVFIARASAHRPKTTFLGLWLRPRHVETSRIAAGAFFATHWVLYDSPNEPRRVPRCCFAPLLRRGWELVRQLLLLSPVNHKGLLPGFGHRRKSRTKIVKSHKSPKSTTLALTQI